MTNTLPVSAREILAEELGKLDDDLPADEFGAALGEAALAAMERYAAEALSANTIVDDAMFLPLAQQIEEIFQTEPSATRRAMVAARLKHAWNIAAYRVQTNHRREREDT